MLSVGSTNYRPPLERSKSAPKLTSIEEAIGEEEEPAEDEVVILQISDRPTGEEARSLERAPRRRGSFRRRYQRYSKSFSHEPLSSNQIEELVEGSESPPPPPLTDALVPLVDQQSSDDDFEEFLKKHSYDSNDQLCTDFLNYLNLRLEPTKEITRSSVDDSPSLELLESDDFSAPSSLMCLPKKSEGDGGSLSSGCETSSSITVIADADSKAPFSSTGSFSRRRYESCVSESSPVMASPQKHVTFQRSITVPTPGQRLCFVTNTATSRSEFKEIAANLEIIDSDSDESGYVEFQEQNTLFKETCT